MIKTVHDNPVVWEATRLGFELIFSLYKKRIRRIADWGLLKDNPSILDLGCGIGQFSSITGGDYLGLDMNERYIDYARRRNRRPNCSFQCADAATLAHAEARFDGVIIVDLLHHLSDTECGKVLMTASKLARKWVVNFEPIKEESNPLGRWINNHDRGHFIRPLAELHKLYQRSPLSISESVPISLGFATPRAILSQPSALPHSK